MGNNLCGSSKQQSDIQTDFDIKKEADFTRKRIDLKKSIMTPSIDDGYGKRGMMGAQTSKLFDVFKYRMDMPIKFISFSQRKYAGFRNKYEFDRKRILIGTSSSFAIVGYNINEEPQELLFMQIDETEEIRLISFIDDENPTYVLLITFSYSENCTLSRVLCIKPEQDQAFQIIKKDLERTYKATNIVEKELKGGSKVKKPNMALDNFYFSMDEDEGQHVIATEKFQKYLPEEEDEKYDSVGGLGSQEEALKLYGMYASQGLNSEASKTFNFKDKVIYDIFDFKEQKIMTNFFFLKYYSRDVKQKVLTTTDNNNTMQVFQIKQKQTRFPNLPEARNLECKLQEIKQPIQTTKPFVRRARQGSAYVPKPGMSSDSNQMQFAPSQGQGGDSQDELNEKIQLSDKVVWSDYHQKTLFLILKKSTSLELRDIDSSTESHLIDMVYPLSKYGLELERLTHVLVPVLSWSSRSTQPQGLLQKVILMGRGTPKGSKTKRNFLFIFNLNDLLVSKACILSNNEAVTAINYGPYDNGHVMVGFKDGTLMTIDYSTLKVIDTKRVFEYEAVTAINFEPTRLIFVGSEAGEMVALSFIEQKTHYVYLELGRRRYCTLKVPRKNEKAVSSRFNNEPDVECCSAKWSTLKRNL